MKKIKTILTVLLTVVIFSACEKEGNDSNYNPNSTEIQKTDSKNSKSDALIEMIQYSNVTLFLDKSDDEIYFLQMGPAALEIVEPPSSATNVYLDNNGTVLKVEYSGGIIEYNFIGEEVIGIGQIQYQSGVDDGLLVNNNGEVSLVLNYGGYTPKVKCKCFNSNTGYPTNCTSGGSGSTSCSVSSGGSGCSVSCSYSQPCCTEDSDFTF